jgi:hypothetical protein
MSCKFDSSFKPGTCQICLIAQNEGQEDFNIIRAYHTNTTIWNAEISSDYKVKFSAAGNETSMLTGDIALEASKHTAYYNKTATFNISITNNGTSEYFDEVGVCIRKGRVGDKLYFTSPVRLAPGETKNISVGGLVTLTEGDYIISGCYRDGESFINFDTTQDITIEPEANCISSVENGKIVKTVEYYNTAGSRTVSKQTGIVIRKTTYTDGTTKTEKTINK